MRYIRCTLLVVLTIAAAACADVTAPTAHADCGGGASEWTKCMSTSTHP